MDITATATAEFTFDLTTKPFTFQPGCYRVSMEQVMDDYAEDIASTRYVIWDHNGKHPVVAYVCEFREPLQQDVAEDVLLQMAEIVEEGGHSDSIRRSLGF